MSRYAVRIIPKHCPDVSEICVRMFPKYSIEDVFVGTTSNPTLKTISYVKRDPDLYFKIKTQSNVSKILVTYKEANWREYITEDDSRIISKSDTEWVIRRPIMNHTGALTVSFKVLFNGSYSSSSAPLTIQVS